MIWKIRSFLAKQSEKPDQYNLIQRFFGSQNMWENFVSEYIAPLEPKIILDIGCGTAEVIPYLPKGVSYFGIDSNQNYINSCLKRYPHHQFIHGNWNMVDQLLQEPPDLILYLGLLHHLDDNSARSMLQNGYEILETGGKIISLDGSKQNDCGRFENLFYQVDRGRFIRSQQEYGALFPQKPEVFLHENWLRVPYHYAVCQLVKKN